MGKNIAPKHNNNTEHSEEINKTYVMKILRTLNVYKKVSENTKIKEFHRELHVYKIKITLN